MPEAPTPSRAPAARLCSRHPCNSSLAGARPRPQPRGGASLLFRWAGDSAVLVRLPDVLTPEQVRQCRHVVEQAEWVDGRVTAGFQSAKAKHNMQVPEGHPAARQAGDMILAALERN